MSAQDLARRYQLRVCWRYHINQIDDAYYAKALNVQLGHKPQWPQALWSKK